MKAHWWVLMRRHRPWCFWSNRLFPTSKETEAARFRTAEAARQHAAAFPELQEWVVRQWWPGRFSEEAR